jgi:hypothetical protein
MENMFDVDAVREAATAAVRNSPDGWYTYVIRLFSNQLDVVTCFTCRSEADILRVYFRLDG